MRWCLAIGCGLAIGLSTGCGDPLHDLLALLQVRAPADAIDCGSAGGLEAGNLDASRACVVAAAQAHRSYRVLIDQPVADGRIAIGWIGHASGSGERLDYQASYGQLGCGDDEALAWTACARLVDRGAACASLADDLCVACE